MRRTGWIWISIGYLVVAGGCAGSQRKSASAHSATPSGESTKATSRRGPSRPEPFSPRAPWGGRAAERERERSRDAPRASAGEPRERQQVAGQDTAQEVEEQRPLQVLEGRASYYASTFDGRLTKSGEPYDPKAMTAATKASGPPLGAVLRVVRNDTGASVTVRVNDRMPPTAGATVDLSRAAAERLDMIDAGIVSVRIEVLSVPEAEARPGETTQ